MLDRVWRKGNPLTLLVGTQVALVVKNLPTYVGDKREEGSNPGFGRSPGGEHGNLLQYSCLENPMDRGAWQAAIHRVTNN